MSADDDVDPSIEDEAREAFGLFDRDSVGLVTAADARVALSALGVELEPRAVDGRALSSRRQCRFARGRLDRVCAVYEDARSDDSGTGTRSRSAVMQTPPSMASMSVRANSTAPR